jgi:drug/metabolite transporter (DMT)-like permease
VSSLIVTRTPIVIPKQMLSLAMLSLIGIFGFIAQILMTMGYQIQAAGSASMGIYSQVIFGVILERLVFGTVPSILSILGTALILSSVLYVTMAKAKDGGNYGKIALPGGEGVEEGRGLFEPYGDSDVEVEG